MIKTGKRRPGRPAKHGAFSLLYKGTVDEKRIYVKQFIEDTHAALIQDKGGEEGVTAMERIAIDKLATLLGVTRLIEEWVAEKGVFQNPSGFLQPSLSQRYLGWNKQILDCLRLLGMNRKAVSGGPTLADVIAEYDAKATPKDGIPPKRAKIGEGEGSDIFSESVKS